MGLACVESGNYSGASMWLRKAFSTFFKCLGPEDPITLNIYSQFTEIDKNQDNFELQGVAYQNLPQAIIQAEQENLSLQK